MRSALVLVAGIWLAACSAGRNAGEVCFETADCRPELACVDGRCNLPGTCPGDAPIKCRDGSGCCPLSHSICCDDGQCHETVTSCLAATCKSTGQSCRTSTDCCGALTCNSLTKTCKSSTPPACSGRACTSSAGCCADFACSRFGKTCHAARNLATGDPCTAHAQCLSGECSNYCTKTCTSTAACGSANSCLETATGPACIPFCQTNADCTIFGAGITCQESTDLNGLKLKGCFGSQ